LIRHGFVVRHKALVNGTRVPWEVPAAGVVILLGLIVALRPPPAPATPVAAGAAPVTFAQVKAVMEQRCVICHNAQVASKNVRLDTPEEIARHAAQIHQQVNVLKLMPMNNSTQITDAERALLARWHAEGAKLD
nr:hypothetical protein [Ideonella sp.]